MNKYLYVLLSLCLLFGSLKAEDFSLDLGSGIWTQKVRGPISTSFRTIESDELGFDTEQQLYVWMSLKHSIGILPNIRLEYTNVNFQGSRDNLLGSTSYSEVGLKQADLILYYTLLDDYAMTTIDMGLDLKYADVVFKDENSVLKMYNISGINEQEKVILPAVYTRLRFDLPFDIGIEGIAKYAQYKHTKLLDAQVKIDYTITDTLPMKVGFEIGYRYENLDLDANDFDELTVSGDVIIEGVFVGFVIKL